MCGWKAEISQYAVAHESRNMTAVVSNRITATALKFTKNFCQILGIKSRRQSRRTDNVAKQDGEMTPFGFDVGQPGKSTKLIKSFRRRWIRVRILRSRLDKRLAVSKRYSELFEFLVLEKEKDLAIDVVRSEQIGVLAEADAFQPLMQIAHLRSKRREAALMVLAQSKSQLLERIPQFEAPSTSTRVMAGFVPVTSIILLGA
jgi:hypothetical protein